MFSAISIIILRQNFVFLAILYMQTGSTLNKLTVSILCYLLTDPSVEFVGSGIVNVDEDTPSISLTLASSTTGADGLVELYTTDGTATGEKNEHNKHE